MFYRQNYAKNPVFLSSTFYGMKKNYDICTAKPEKGLNVVAQVPSGRKKQTNNNTFLQNDKS